MDISIPFDWNATAAEVTDPAALDATFEQAITISNQPAIPISDADTPPNIAAVAPAVFGSISEPGFGHRLKRMLLRATRIAIIQFDANRDLRFRLHTVRWP